MNTVSASKIASPGAGDSYIDAIPKEVSHGKGKANPIPAMIAGYVAGSSGTVVGYPLDSLKVWIQTNTLGKNKHLGANKGPKLQKDSTTNQNSCGKSRSRSSGASKRDILKSSKVSGAKRSNSTTVDPKITTAVEERAASAAARITKPASTVARTVRALYSGVTGPLVTVGMVQSVNFATYDATRRFLYSQQHHHYQGGTFHDEKEYLTQDSLKNVAMAGSAGGTATAILTAPLLMIKINQQISGNSFRKACREIFFRGSGEDRQFRPLRPYGSAFVPHLLSETVGRAIYVTTYEGLKRSLLSSKKSNHGDITKNDINAPISLSLRERMACAAASGVVCWGTFFPLDSLRNRMYHAASRQPKATMGNSASKKTLTVLETMKIMRKERSFYRGFTVSILRAGPVAASVLPVYDLTLEWLSSTL